MNMLVGIQMQTWTHAFRHLQFSKDENVLPTVGIESGTGSGRMVHGMEEWDILGNICRCT